MTAEATASPASTGSSTRPEHPAVLLLDVSRRASGWALWGMSLAERVRRQVSLCGIRRVVLWLGDPDGDTDDEIRWRPDLQQLHPQQCDVARTAADLSALLEDDLTGNAGLLIADGDVVHDDRLFDHLLRLGPDHVVGTSSESLLWMSADHWCRKSPRWPDEGLRGLVGDLPHTDLDDIGDYVPELRLTLPPFMIRLNDEQQLRAVDRLMYRRTFKGVIDAIARYGYYHLVRFITRGLSRTTWSPNLFTVLSIAGIWVAIPCFATGHILGGCVSAWVGVILDSVDGKLARLTLNLSDAMGTIEHLSAMPGLGLWFVAVGWHLTSGDLLTPSAPMVACWVTVTSFLIDKVVSGTFRQRFGRELFDARPFDAFFHLLAVRRNMHLLILTMGVLLGNTTAAFCTMAAGMGLTLLIHVGRFAWIAATGGVQTTRS